MFIKSHCKYQITFICLKPNKIQKMVFLVKRREITHINEIMYRSNSQTFRFFLRGHFRLDDINPTKDHVLRTHMSDHVSVTLIFVFF